MMDFESFPSVRFLSLGLVGSLAFGCGSSANSSLGVLLEPEESITAGLEAGEEVENIRDGWNAEFSHFTVAFGGVTLTYEGEKTKEGEGGLLAELTKIPSSGATWFTAEELEAVRYDFGYSIVSAKDVSEELEVDADVSSTMRDEGLSMYFEGTLTKEGGVSCPPENLAKVEGKTSSGKNAAGVACYDNPTVKFVVKVPRAIALGPCEADGVPGVALAAEQTKSVAITLHGDHLFFNGFPTGDEASVLRLAQWLADADLNLDGEVSWEELGELRPSDLSEMDERFELGSAPLAIDSLQDYVIAQATTQGHYQGEGECPIQFP